MAVIGYDVSEQLDVEPAKYFVVVTKREKRACKHCEESGVGCGPPLRRGSSKRVWSAAPGGDRYSGREIQRITSRVYRQSAILEREAGVEISRATMADGMNAWWASYSYPSPR